MNHIHRFITIVSFFLLLGIFIARESSSGFATNIEKAANAWLMGAAKEPEGIEGIILVQQSDENEKLSSINAALFLRAASLLGAKVAAIASSDLIPNDGSLLSSLLEDPTRLKCAVVGACRLSNEGTNTGLPPAMVKTYPIRHPALERFSTSYSALPNAPGISGGFNNLPENSSANPQFFTVALLNDNTVASLPLQIVCEEARMRGVAITEVYEDSWKFSNGSHLHFSSDGLATLIPGNLKRITRIDLDDLLLAAERFEQNIGGSEIITAIINDRILILGPLAEKTPQTVQFDNEPPLSQPEVIALAIATLQNSMINKSTHWAIQGIVLLIFSLFGSLTIKMKSLDAVFALTILLGFYILMSMAVVSELSLIPPILAPVIICIAAILSRAFIKKQPERNCPP